MSMDHVDRANLAIATNPAYRYNPTTGLSVVGIRQPYRWMLRNKHDICYASIKERPDGGAQVILTVNDYIALVWRFGNYGLACKHVSRHVPRTYMRSWEQQLEAYAELAAN